MSNRRTKAWVMVRVLRETHARLRELSRLWHKVSGYRDNVPAPNDQDVISLDRVIATLLDRDEAHRRRSRSKVSAKRVTER
jgi:hypothetical protein